MKKLCFALLLCLLLCVGASAFFSQAATTPCEPGSHKFGAWTTITPAGCTTQGTQERVCTLCGEKETQKTNALQHDYSETLQLVKAATCTEDGMEAYVCSRCGDTKGLVILEKTGHNYSDWQVKTPAGCETDGEEVQICANCGDVISRLLTATGHEEVIDEAVPAKCTVNGKSAGTHCKNCGKIFIKQEVIRAPGHTIVIDEAVAPTCTEDGLTEGSHCAVCNQTLKKQNVIPKHGHKTVIDEAVASTCSTPGKTEGSHCEYCGEVFFAQKDLPLRSHEFKTETIKRTCTTDGYVLHTCIHCGITDKSDFDYATGHHYVYTKAIQETCTKNGRTTQVSCSVCKEIIEPARVVPKLGHQWKTAVTPATTAKDGTAVTTCSVCGAAQGKPVVIPKIASIKLSKTKYVCDNKKKTPTVTVTDAKGKVLTYKTDYKLTYDSGRKQVGTYYITVTFRGNYSGTKALKFFIRLGAPTITAAKAKAKAVGLNWNKVPGATKYLVYYAPAANGPFKKAGSTTKNAINVKKLASGRTYYFRVLACTVSTTGENAFSAYSPVVEAHVK